ncbi:MAG: hypothetical protein OQJ99_08800 [Rhodospirillales bacterium]|nr:hypothetical protein [Rhodospirillales bacterium]MCW8861531.1 hypothetical protein [Rhodospirillales bacterium]MCW8952896.1 hypothetical protein [Rhodospirillales bacterium]MCW8971371.1 hypothetical protein [Rhodospirillales bacterium]MCW9001660.1 hypothetical protein [Rhodospirillales bacterium]
MKDIVERLRDIDEDSLIMNVLRDCMDAADEIDRLRQECASKKQALKEIKKMVVSEEKRS